MSKKITIIGAGMMGSALAFPAAENGHEVHIVGTCLDDEIIDGYIATGKHEKFCRPFPKNVHFHYFKDWKSVTEGSDFVIGGVSSFGVDWFLEEILVNLDPNMPVLSVTKGLRATEDGTLLSYPGYWESELAKRGIHRTICAVGGPCTSYELVFMDPTEVGFCGKDNDALRMMKEAMARPYYHISLTNDVIGLESAVALKNAFAMAVTLAVGLNIRWHGEEEPQHYNSQAGTFSQAVRETHALMQIQGGTFESECIGLGDLYVTIFSGRTRRCGVLMGKGLNYDQVTEALAGITLESLVITRVMGQAIRRKAELGMVDLKDFPLLMHIVDILDNGKADSDMPWEEFTYEHLR
ncbi:MAG: glycerol-3-phosphate dehydrogenase [Rikenellaceae bacterium]|nr:glycerol-3-phosphate dehydrogenase [Rikenellaceae bacterium]